jgi:hypothetical protein
MAQLQHARSARRAGRIPNVRALNAKRARSLACRHDMTRDDACVAA